MVSCYSSLEHTSPVAFLWIGLCLTSSRKAISSHSGSHLSSGVCFVCFIFLTRGNVLSQSTHDHLHTPRTTRSTVITTDTASFRKQRGVSHHSAWWSLCTGQVELASPILSRRTQRSQTRVHGAHARRHDLAKLASRSQTRPWSGPLLWQKVHKCLDFQQ